MSDLQISPDAREAAKKLGRKLCAWDAISGQPAVMQFIEDKIAAALTAFAATGSARSPRDADACDHGMRMVEIASRCEACDALLPVSDAVREAFASADVTPEETLTDLLACCRAWSPEARILGNVRAGDAALALAQLLRRASVAERSAAPSASAARQTDATTEDVERDAVVRYLRETLVGNHPAYADTFRHAAHQIEHNAHRMGVSPAATAASRNAAPRTKETILLAHRYACGCEKLDVDRLCEELRTNLRGAHAG